MTSRYLITIFTHATLRQLSIVSIPPAPPAPLKPCAIVVQSSQQQQLFGRTIRVRARRRRVTVRHRSTVCFDFASRAQVRRRPSPSPRRQCAHPAEQTSGLLHNELRTERPVATTDNQNDNRRRRADPSSSTAT